MKTILIPTDFSANAKNAAKYAISLFGGDPANEFVLFNSYDLLFSNPEVVISVFDMMEEDSKRGLELEKQYLSTLFPDKEFDIEVVSRRGETVRTIDDYAQKINADYIVMGTKGASGLKETFIGSNAAAVIKKATCPVILVPEEMDFKEPGEIIFATDYKGLEDIDELEPLRHLSSKYNAGITLLNVAKPGGIPDANQAVQGLKLNSYFNPSMVTFEFIEESDVETGINQLLETGKYDILALVERKLGFLESLFHKSISKQLAYHIKIPILIMHDK